MNSFLSSPSFFLRSLVSAALLAAGLSAMTAASANGNIEPLTDILSEPSSAGLGAVTSFELSPYREAGTRYDLLPLYLYEGERLFLHANRVGVKL
ncbi:MAG: MipA/OmpV family protein, partial [Polaromonas sp.]|nr:MipA/OmpV family protein [Polaromonas sp.]